MKICPEHGSARRPESCFCAICGRALEPEPRRYIPAPPATGTDIFECPRCGQHGFWPWRYCDRDGAELEPQNDDAREVQAIWRQQDARAKATGGERETDSHRAPAS